MTRIDDKFYSYSGELRLSVIKNGRRIYEEVFHNAGTQYLFKYMLSCLIGKPNTQKRPGKLFLYDSNDTLLLNYGIIYDTVTEPAPTSTTDDFSDEFIEYTFLIPGTSLPANTMLKNFKLASMSTSSIISREDIYATASLSTDIAIDATTNVELKWRLQMTNS